MMKGAQKLFFATIASAAKNSFKMKIQRFFFILPIAILSGCMTTAPYNKADLSETHGIAYASHIEDDFRVQKVGTTAFNNAFHSFEYSGDINKVVVSSIKGHLQNGPIKRKSVQADAKWLSENFDLNVWTRDVKGMDAYLDDLAGKGINLLILVLDRYGTTDPIGGTNVSLSGFGYYQRALFGNEKDYLYFLPVIHFIDTEAKKVHLSRIADSFVRAETTIGDEESLESFSKRERQALESEIEELVDYTMVNFIGQEGL